MSDRLSHCDSSLRVERSLRVGLACLAFLLAGGCDGLGSPGDPTGTRREVVERINSARMQVRLCGSQVFHAASPLRWNGTLAASSLRHARDLARNGLAGHIGSDGSRPQERIAEAGYQAQASGEIVAVGTASLSTVMQAWLESPGHCAVLMNPHFTEAGAEVEGELAGHRLEQALGLERYAAVRHHSMNSVASTQTSERTPIAHSVQPVRTWYRIGWSRPSTCSCRPCPRRRFFLLNSAPLGCPGL